MHLYCYNINLCIHVYIQDGQSANDQFTSDDIIGMSSGAIQYFLDKLRSKVNIMCGCTCVALGVLCCFGLFVCLTLLASFFLPSHLSFKNMYCKPRKNSVRYI